MDAELQDRADRRLEERIRDEGISDPRVVCRGHLKELRARDPDAYERAVERYRTSLVPGVAQGSDDAVDLWLEYAAGLTEQLEEGRTVAIDATGRAGPLEGRWNRKDLVVHLPMNRSAPALLVAAPAELSRAQTATRGLLVEGKQQMEAPSE